jgi:glycerol-3-phosphate dehydrogenase
MQYGTRASDLLGPAQRLEDMGDSFGADLTAREVDYLMEQEWARTADDVLWRRTKLGLRVGLPDKERLESYMAKRRMERKK